MSHSSPSLSSPRLFASHLRTTDDLVADYHAALADEAAFKGVSEAEVLTSRAETCGGERPEQEEDELRPLDDEVRAMRPPRTSGSGAKRGRVTRTQGDSEVAGRSNTDTTPKRATKRRRRADDPAPSVSPSGPLRRAFVLPRRLPPQREPVQDESDDELLEALDALIAATPARAKRARSGEEEVEEEVEELEV